MSKGKLIKVCGECANYDWKKHRCKLGCNEGEPQDPFYSDCPLPTVDIAPEWISVAERLPDEKQKVLLYSPTDGINIGHRLDEVGRFYVSKSYPDRPTHWMPLPEPPKGV